MVTVKGLAQFAHHVRVALRMAYDGSAFDSYARQPGRRTVEGALIEALRHEGLVELRTGSRTDAGVSALANVCRADLDRPHRRGLVPALQARLPSGLWCTGVAPVSDGFDPRRAMWRQYRYWALDEGEDEGRMKEAAAAFAGRHDMGAFARIEAGRAPERTVLECTVRKAEGYWCIGVRGESFLWGQVRRMASAIRAVGRGQAEVGDVRRALARGIVHPRFGTAPAAGLVLEHVEYPGLEWEGRVESRRIGPFRVQARVRGELARHLGAFVHQDVLRSTT